MRKLPTFYQYEAPTVIKEVERLTNHLKNSLVGLHPHCFEYNHQWAVVSQSIMLHIESIMTRWRQQRQVVGFNAAVIAQKSDRVTTRDPLGNDLPCFMTTFVLDFRSFVLDVTDAVACFLSSRSTMIRFFDNCSWIKITFGPQDKKKLYTIDEGTFFFFGIASGLLDLPSLGPSQ